MKRPGPRTSSAIHRRASHGAAHFRRPGGRFRQSRSSGPFPAGRPAARRSPRQCTRPAACRACAAWRQPVGGVHARDRTKRVPQGVVVTDQRDGLCPDRQHVQALDQRQTDHGADRVAGAAGPVEFLKLSDQRGSPRLSRSAPTGAAPRARATTEVTMESHLPGQDPGRW